MHSNAGLHSQPYQVTRNYTNKWPFGKATFCCCGSSAPDKQRDPCQAGSFTNCNLRILGKVLTEAGSPEPQ